MMGEEGRRQRFRGMSRKTDFDPFRMQEVFVPVLLHLAMILASELQRFKPNEEASEVWKE